MSSSFRSQKSAMNEVVNAVSLLKERGGSSSADIYFVLDNLHGRVNRNEVQKALRSAVSKGILKSQNHRYKLNTRRSLITKRVSTRKSVGQRTAKTGRSFRNYKSAHKFDRKIQRVESRQSFMSSDFDEVPVQNYECKCHRVKLTRSCARPNRSYSFEKIKNLLPCDCDTSSERRSYTDMSFSSAESEPKRKRTNKQNKRKRPRPKKTMMLQQDVEEANEGTKEKSEEDENTTNENQLTQKGSEKSIAENSSDVKESRQETKKSEEGQGSKANKKPSASQNNESAETDSIIGAPSSSSARRSTRASITGKVKVKSEKSSVGTLGQQHRYPTRLKTKQDASKS